MDHSVLTLGILVILLGISNVFAAAVPLGAITVGSGGKYSTLSAALNDTSSNVYYVYAGTYNGQVAISRADVVIYGETSSAASYTGNKVTLTDNVPASSAGSNDKSGTVRILATGVKLYNLDIANTFGKPTFRELEYKRAWHTDTSQSLAGRAVAGHCPQCASWELWGTQDTLLANVGTQIYARGYISGSVDFIFGKSASIWISNTVIETTGSGYITASGRSKLDANYYVFDECTIRGSGSSFLGRPWRNYARVIYQNSSIGSNVKPAGWSVWGQFEHQNGSCHLWRI